MAKIPLETITIDPSLQIREKSPDGKLYDESLVEEYLAVVSAASDVDLPEVIIWLRDGERVLGAGFHRYEAYCRAGRKNIPAVIRPWIDLETAHRVAEDDNLNHLKHGKPPTKAERKKILFARWDRGHTWRLWTDVALAIELRVSAATIGRWRDEWKELNPDSDINNVRVDRNGREINTENIGRKPSQVHRDEINAKIVELKTKRDKLHSDLEIAQRQQVDVSQISLSYQRVQSELDQLVNGGSASVAAYQEFIDDDWDDSDSPTDPLPTPLPQPIPRPVDVLDEQGRQKVIPQHRKVYWDMTGVALYDSEIRAITRNPHQNRRVMEAAVFCLEDLAKLLEHAMFSDYAPEAFMKLREALGSARSQIELIEDKWNEHN